nr:hypothetical protein CFP56_21041 [Quercus suber]
MPGQPRISTMHPSIHDPLCTLSCQKILRSGTAVLSRFMVIRHWSSKKAIGGNDACSPYARLPKRRPRVDPHISVFRRLCWQTCDKLARIKTAICSSAVTFYVSMSIIASEILPPERSASIRCAARRVYNSNYPHQQPHQSKACWAELRTYHLLHAQVTSLLRASA